MARLRIHALGVAARLLPAPTPFMLTGPGSSLQLAQLIADYGACSVLVVTDRVLVELEVVAPVLTALKEAGLAVSLFSAVEPDPTIQTILAGIEQLRASGATAVLAVGGGSPIDAAKAMVACRASGYRAGSDTHGWPAGVGNGGHGHGRSHTRDRVPPLHALHTCVVSPVRGGCPHHFSRSSAGLAKRP